MNLQPINPTPKSPMLCCGCGKFQAVHADLDGEPFKALYCTACAIHRQAVKVQQIDMWFPVGGGRARIEGGVRGVVEQAVREYVAGIDPYRSPYHDAVMYNTHTGLWQTEIRWYTLD